MLKPLEAKKEQGRRPLKENCKATAQHSDRPINRTNSMLLKRPNVPNIKN